jgi:hypothetical protein
VQTASSSNFTCCMHSVSKFNCSERSSPLFHLVTPPTTSHRISLYANCLHRTSFHLTCSLFLRSSPHLRSCAAAS